MPLPSSFPMWISSPANHARLFQQRVWKKGFNRTLMHLMCINQSFELKSLICHQWRLHWRIKSCESLRFPKTPCCGCGTISLLIVRDFRSQVFHLIPNTLRLSTLNKDSEWTCLKISEPRRQHLCKGSYNAIKSMMTSEQIMPRVLSRSSLRVFFINYRYQVSIFPVCYTKRRTSYEKYYSHDIMLMDYGW